MTIFLPFLLKHWRELTVAGVIIALGLFVLYERHEGYQEGYQKRADEDTALALKAAQDARRKEQEATRITSDIGLKSAAKEQEIRVRTETIIQKVPVYVSPETDKRYPLPVGFVRLHDAAALGLDVSGIPAPAGQSDDSPSAVTASSAASVIASNYGSCNTYREQLMALQAWVKAQEAAAK